MSHSSNRPNDNVVAPESDTTSGQHFPAGDSLTSAPDRLVDQRVGNFRLLERIGEGATAMVYRAEHVQLGRIYAVKILHPMIATRPGMRDRFLFEAQTAAQLEHENIIFINDFAIDPQFGPYMVMEHLNGYTLKDLLVQHGPIPLPRVLSISLQVCLALSLAHSQGIIHRDLKPENIFLESRVNQPERVKILDFGIARLAQSTNSITGDGKLIGTPLYMSPEQCRGQKKLTAASDIYSFGITLYEMLTGNTPFQSDSPHKLIIDHFLATPPDLSYTFPEELRQLQRDLLAKEPGDRPQSFETLAQRLREAIEQTQAHMPSNLLYTTMEDTQVPPDFLQQLEDLQQRQELADSPHLQVASRTASSPKSTVRSTMLYHPSEPEAPESVSPSVTPDSANKPAPSRPNLTSTLQFPLAPEPEKAAQAAPVQATSRKPVVVKRRTPVPKSQTRSQDPLLNDLEQLFSSPPEGQDAPVPPGQTAWDVPVHGLHALHPEDLTASSSSTHTELPQLSSASASLESHDHTPVPSLQSRQEQEQKGKEPHLVFRTTSSSTPADLSKTMDWVAMEPLVKVSLEKASTTRPPLLPPPGSALHTTAPYLSTPASAEFPILVANPPQQGQSSSSLTPPPSSLTPPPRSSDLSLPHPPVTLEENLFTPSPLEFALFNNDSATEVELGYTFQPRRKRLTQRWWFWLLLFCAFGASVYFLYKVIMASALPPILTV